jgi:hypothetical protein
MEMNAMTTEENAIAQATAAAEQTEAKSPLNHVGKSVSRYHLYDGLSAPTPLCQVLPDLLRPGGPGRIQLGKIDGANHRFRELAVSALNCSVR